MRFTEFAAWGGIWRNVDGILAEHWRKFWQNFRQNSGGMGGWLGGMGGWLGRKTWHFFRLLARRKRPRQKSKKML